MKKNYFLSFGLLSCSIFSCSLQAMLVEHNKILWNSQSDTCHIARLDKDSVLTIADHTYNVCDIKSLKTTCKWAYEKVYVSDVFLDRQFLDRNREDFSFAGARTDSSLCLKMLRRLAYEHDQLQNNFFHFTDQKKMPLLTPEFFRKFNLISEGINNLLEKYPRKDHLKSNIKNYLPLLRDSSSRDISTRYNCLENYLWIGNNEYIDIELIKQTIADSNGAWTKTGLLWRIAYLNDDDLLYTFLDKMQKSQLYDYPGDDSVFVVLAICQKHEALSYLINKNPEKKEDYFRKCGHILLYKFLYDGCQDFFDPIKQNKTSDRGLSYKKFHATLDLLLENSSNLNGIILESPYQGTILHHAFSLGLVEVIEKLLRYKADVNAIDRYGSTVLLDVCKGESQESLALIQLLIDNKANINAVNSIGNTPLHHAVKSNKLEIMRVLLEKGANPNIRNDFGYTPLHNINYRTTPEMIELFHQYKADFNIRDQQGRVPLQCENLLQEETINALRSCGAYIPTPTITKVKIILGCSLSITVLIAAAIRFYMK